MTEKRFMLITVDDGSSPPTLDLYLFDDLGELEHAVPSRMVDALHAPFMDFSGQAKAGDVRSGNLLGCDYVLVCGRSKPDGLCLKLSHGLMQIMRVLEGGDPALVPAPNAPMHRSMVSQIVGRAQDRFSELRREPAKSHGENLYTLITRRSHSGPMIDSGNAYSDLLDIAADQLPAEYTREAWADRVRAFDACAEPGYYVTGVDYVIICEHRSPAPPTKSREQVEELKSKWLADPCWDIENTAGFDAWYHELLAYRLDLEVASLRLRNATLQAVHAKADTAKRPRLFEFVNGSEIDVDRYIALDATAREHVATFQLHHSYHRVYFDSDEQREAELERMRAFRDGRAS
jgi:hypothetical protein